MPQFRTTQFRTTQLRTTQLRTSRSSRLHGDGLAAALFAGSPIERTALTLGTGLALFVMFLVYTQAMRGLRPSSRPSRARPARPVDPESEASLYLSSEDQGIRRAVKYLPQTWAPHATHCVQTENGTYVYFNEWTKESAKVLKFTPCAIISNRKGDKPGDRPYTVVSDKAYVTFKDEVSPSGKNPGPVVQAGLEGTVEITGPNNLRIRGRNFFFQREEMRIYSDNKVEILADKHRALAKGIQIELIAEQKARSDEALAISGVSSVKLLQDVNMTLVSSGDSPGSPLPGIAKPANPADPANKEPRIVRTHCDGSFVFYLESRIATFERNVRIRRETSPGKFDQLFADENVEITFEKKPDAKKPGDAKKPTDAKPPDAKQPPADHPGAKTAAVAATDKAAGPGAKAGGAEPAAKSPGGLESDLTFKSIHAQGKIVELTSDVNGLRSQMRDLTYDQTAREAKLTWIPREGDNNERTIREKNGQIRKVPAAPNRVWVAQHGSVLRSQKIQLDHDPQGEVTHVMCLGEGEMRHVEEKTGEEDLAAYWHKEMRKYPDPKSPNFDLIHLEEALIEQPKQGAGIAANFIRLWLVRENRNAQTARANQPPVRKGQQPQPSGPHLDHMLAWQKVGMVSPQMECETDRLEIWFEDAPGPPRRAPVSKPRQRANLVPTSERVVRGAPVPASFASTTGISASPAGAPANASATQPTGKSNPNDLFSATGSSEPYNLTAARVRVHLIQFPDGQGQQPQVADMLAWENVQLTQAHADAAEPLVINGNVLEVHNRGELDQEMIVFGQPAHVRDRGAHIEGGHIVFNRLRDTADVDGPGRLQLPVQSDSQAQGANREQTKGGEPAQPLDVEWHRKMHFDGKTAHFLVNVHTTMTDATSHSEIRCLNMDVTLTKPYSFTQQTSEADRPAVDTVFCQGDVEFESEATQDDHLAEKRRGRFMDLLVHKLTGKSTAHGPGLLRVWRHNENGQSSMSQFTMAQSNAPPKNRKATTWEFNQVAFVGTMDGDFLDAMSGRSRAKSGPKVQQTSSSNALLASSGAWTAVFRDHVQVIYGPVDQPMELVSRDELSEEAGCLLCEYLQVMQRPQAGTVPQHIEMLAQGNAKIEGKTFTGESDTVTYDGSKSQYVLIGDSASPARLWRQLKLGGAQTRNVANRIHFNPMTHTVKEDGAKGLDVQR
jgi:hypothetical protein